MCTRSLINHSPLRPNPSPFPYTTLFRSPHTTVRIAYSLEYGLDEMEMHADAIHPGERVILVDDLIATGGTAEGAVKLLRQIGANVVAACFIIDLPDLGGAAKLRAMDVPVRTLMAFEGH